MKVYMNIPVTETEDARILNAKDCKIIQTTQDTDERKEAEARLLVRNEGLVFALVNRLRQMCSTCFEEDDMLQEVRIGLLRAAKTYNPEKAVFSTYAWKWMWQFATRGVANYSPTIRIPIHITDLLRNTAKKYGVPYDSAEFLNRLNADKQIKETEKTAILDALSVMNVISIDAPFAKNNDNDSATSLGEMIDSGCRVEDACDYDSIGDTLQQGMKRTLTDKEQWVINNRFGFDGCDIRTLEWCGQNMPGGEVTRERARQIECAAIRKLRKLGTRNHWNELLYSSAM